MRVAIVRPAVEPFGLRCLQELATEQKVLVPRVCTVRGGSQAQWL